MTTPCVSNAVKAADNKVTAKEVEQALKDFVGADLTRAEEAKAIARKVLNSPNPKLKEQIVQAAKTEKYRKYLRIQKKQNLQRMVDTTAEKFGSPSMGLYAALGGTVRTFEGSRTSASQLYHQYRGRYEGGFIYDLEKAGVAKDWRSREHTSDIADE